MTEHEQKLYELAEKVKDLDTAIKTASFRMMRTRKNLKMCKETCEQTNEMIGEINGRNAKHQ
jgi:outer membrane murein-binding lipoprotein Lpp